MGILYRFWPRETGPAEDDLALTRRLRQLFEEQREADQRLPGQAQASAAAADRAKLSAGSDLETPSGGKPGVAAPEERIGAKIATKAQSTTEEVTEGSCLAPPCVPANVSTESGVCHAPERDSKPRHRVKIVRRKSRKRR